MDEALRALNRFGLGARTGEARALGDPRGWLHAQLDARSGTRAHAVGSTDGIGSRSGAAALGRAAEVLRDLREAQRARDTEAQAEARRRLGDLRQEDARALLVERVRSQAPFVERLVAFWSNHLCVSADAKPQVAALAGAYELEAIRPHVLGRFEDMLLASARHPAMLFYLDNAQSVGPDSPAGRRSARRSNARGLNENYARELLELHTVGVDGGYDQADVEALAEIMTGWTVAGVGPVARPDEPLGFVFRPALHQPGDKQVLGRRYRDSGVEEGEQVVRELAHAPATARFLATKLARHFVADDPPPAAVDRIAAVYRDTGGDLAAVSHALVELEQAWRPEHRKLRTPQDWVVAVFRAVRLDDVPPRAPAILRQLRHTPWSPAAPKGYDDTVDAWSDPDSLMNRAELARSIAGAVTQGRGAGRNPSGVDPRMVLDVIDVDDDDPLRTLLSDSSIPAAERLALGFGGPAFHWR